MGQNHRVMERRVWVPMWGMRAACRVRWARAWALAWALCVSAVKKPYLRCRLLHLRHQTVPQRAFRRCLCAGVGVGAAAPTPCCPFIYLLPRPDLRERNSGSRSEVVVRRGVGHGGSDALLAPRGGRGQREHAEQDHEGQRGALHLAPKGARAGGAAGAARGTQEKASSKGGKREEGRRGRERRYCGREGLVVGVGGWGDV